MSLKYYLNLMFICTLICWAIFVSVILFVNPEKTGFLGFLLFYSSLFLSILGTGSLLGFILGARLKRRPIFSEVSLAFRRSLWLSMFIIIVLILKRANLFYWWNILLLFLFFLVLEFFCLSIGRKYTYEKSNSSANRPGA